MTQRLRPPVAAVRNAEAKPAAKASTSGQEPDAERRSGAARTRESGGGWFDRPESLDAEPVGPEATAPGRAGPPVVPGSTSAPGKAGAPAADEDTPSGANETVRLDRPGVVKVIGGTRRFHSSSCPLIKGAEPGSIQTMQKAEAESKGLTPCSVCQHDHQRVG
ncbi:hypothetical protein [Nonomuraea africana]|uniref:Ada DNA repair metal-binding domain-containing protein n=1 Tax=Nonomuraea africana TaxID=46171 RepID=A0ABR9KHC6_9ACTN|nr:hypothetical protein [Nonomuraea africana]MBE1561406.1 hypothetical protein [Nonomuraea africana]